MIVLRLEVRAPQAGMVPLDPGAGVNGPVHAALKFVLIWNAAGFDSCQELGETVLDTPGPLSYPAARRGLRLVLSVNAPGKWQIRHTHLLLSGSLLTPRWLRSRSASPSAAELQTGALCPVLKPFPAAYGGLI